MSLRAAERLIHSNPVAAGALVAEARDASSRALTDLRDLVRGIHPPVLADRGLRDAVRACRSWSCPSMSSSCTPASCWPIRRAESATCSKTGSSVTKFVDAIRAVASGGTAMDPEVIAKLLARRPGDERWPR
jgi:hypothetical protein